MTTTTHGVDLRTVIATATVPGPTTTTSSTGPASTVTESVPGVTSTSVLTGPASTVTHKVAGPTETVTEASKNLAYTGSDLRPPLTWVLLLGLAGIACYGWAFGLRRKGGH